MLTPINVLNTDPADLAPDMAANTGPDKGASGFQARLGEAMATPDSDGRPGPAADMGEELPPGGSELPFDLPVPIVDPISQTLVDEQSVIAIGRLQDAPADKTLPLSIETRADTTEVELSIAGYPYGTAPGLVVNDLTTGQVRASRDRGSPALTSPVTDAPVARILAHQRGGMEIDPGARVAAVERLAVAENTELSRQIAGMTSAQAGQVAEKFDGLHRKLAIAAAQTAPLAVDNPLSAGAGASARLLPAAPIQAGIDIPVLDDAWGEALNERVLWMAGKSIQKAEIRLHPAELGPIRIEVSIVDDAAKVSFNAQHALTREAIESALPRLREMLDENGISLADTDVSDTGNQNSEPTDEKDALGAARGDGDEAAEHVERGSGAVASRPGSGLVDTFV